MFDTERFIAECCTALQGERMQHDMKDVVARAVADPTSLMAALGEPTEGGLKPIYRSPELTIVNVVWQPKMVIQPHNHELWAVIGIYSGREDNILWRRLPEEAQGRIESVGAKSLCTGDTLALGTDVIHSVVNPIPRLTGAIHVYGGDFFAQPRSEWDPELLIEKPYDMEKVLRMFAGRD